MKQTDSFLTVESLMDLCRQSCEKTGGRYDENDQFFVYENFPKACWYSRLHVFDAPRDVAFLIHLADLCSAPNSPKILSFNQEDLYEGFAKDLEATGFVLAKAQKGMLYDLTTAPAYDTVPEIRRIRPEEIEWWSETCAAGFGNESYPEQYQVQIQFDRDIFYGYFLDGKMVGTNHLNLCGKNAGIHEVSTLPEYRGRGIATKLMQQAIQDAKKAGCTIMSLQASVYGEPVYKKLGFWVVNHIFNYKRG